MPEYWDKYIEKEEEEEDFEKYLEPEPLKKKEISGEDSQSPLEEPISLLDTNKPLQSVIAPEGIEPPTPQDLFEGGVITTQELQQKQKEEKVVYKPTVPIGEQIDSFVQKEYDKFENPKDRLTPKQKLDDFSIDIDNLQDYYSQQISNGIPKEQAISEYTQKVDGLVERYGLERDKEGNVVIGEWDKEKYFKHIDRAQEQLIKAKKSTEKDPFAKDVLDKLYVSTKRLSLLPNRVMAISERIDNAVAKAVTDGDYEPKKGWQNAVKEQDKYLDDLDMTNKRYDTDIIGNLQEGDLADATGNAILQIADNLPNLIMLGLGNAAGYTNSTLALMGLDKASQEYLKTAESKDVTEFAKIVNAVGKGLNEVVFESVGTVPILKSMNKAILDLGEDVVKKEMRTVFASQFEKTLSMLGKFNENGIREAASEMATEIADDLVEKSMINPEKSIGENLGDVGITSYLIGAGMTVPIAMNNARNSRIAKELPEELSPGTKTKLIPKMIESTILQDRIENTNNESLKNAYKEKLKQVNEDVIELIAKEEGIEIEEETKNAKETGTKTKETGIQEELVEEKKEPIHIRDIEENGMETQPPKELEDVRETTEQPKEASTEEVRDLHEQRGEEVPTGRGEVVTSEEISERTDKELGKNLPKYEELKQKKTEVIGNINDRLYRLSNVAALMPEEQRPSKIEDVFGLVKDLSELGYINLELGAKHVIDRLKEFFKVQGIDVDLDSFDNLHDNISNKFDIKEPPPPPEKQEKISDGELDVNLKEETKLGYFIRKIQDKYKRLEDYQKAMTKAGGKITDATDVYGSIELLPSSVRYKVEKAWEDVVKSLPYQEKSIMERAQDDGLETDILNKYMLAQHAAERNNFKIKQKNEEIDAEIISLTDKLDALNPDNYTTEGGYNSAVGRIQGKINKLNEQRLSQEEVDALNSKAGTFVKMIEDSKNGDLYKNYAKEIRDRLVTERQKELVDSGLMSQEDIDVMNETYKNYVPYSMFQEEDFGVSKKKIQVRGKDIYKAKDLIDIDAVSEGKRVDPVAQLLHNNDMTIERAALNRILNEFADLVEQNPNETVRVIKPQYQPKYNKEGELEYVSVDPKYVPNNFNNYVEFKINGKPALLEINDKVLLNTIRGTGVVRSIGLLNKINSYLRGVITVYNPEFLFTNFARDIQTATINLSAEEIKGLRRKMIKNVFPAMKGVMENSLGKTNTEWSQIAEELKELGGEVGWMNLSGLDERISKIETEIKKYNKSKDKSIYKNILSSAGFYLQGASKSIEMSSRLAAYKAAIDSGVSKKQAAVLAKNLTVNFDKKGELGALLNSLYLFSNANIQGVAIMIKNLYKSPRARRTVAGIMAGSVAVNFINAGINGDEWDKIPDALKMRNLIIMKPDGNYIKIPLPYGYNIFKYLGDVTYDVTTGKKDIIDGMMSFFGSVNEAFNPLGAGQKFRQFLPTVMRPVAEIAQNENWLNLPIKPEQKPYKGKIPESQLYFKSIPGYAKWATDKLNEISGGTEKVSGRVDISPEYIDHIVDFVGGGTGRFVTNTLQTTSDLIQGEDLKANNIPFYRTVVGEKHESRNTRIVYDMLKDAGRKKYNTKQKEIFYEALKSAKKEKTIDVNTYFDLKEKFKKDQRAVDKSLKKR